MNSRFISGLSAGLLILLLTGMVAAEEPFNPIIYPTEIPITIPETPIGGDVGYFTISSSPSGADVIFDNQYQGETQVTVQVYSTGTPSHSISVSMPGYETWTKTYSQNPAPGQTIYVQANLVPSKQTGTIYVTSTPQGATATLDGQSSQTTPCSFVVVSPGYHSLTVYMSGYQTYYASPYVTAGQTTTISAALTPAVTTGSLKASSSPSGAAVYVDGNYYGVTQTTIGGLSPGTHSVSLRLAGYQPWTGTVTIYAGQTTTINPSLAPESVYGSISVTSVPSGAAVYLDGVYEGKTRYGSPLTVVSVQPGSHVLLLSLTGYQDYTSTISVTAGMNTPVSVTLSRNPQPATTGSISISSSPSGAEVYLDNVYQGYSPAILQNIAVGSHVVTMKLDGYQDWQSTVQVNAGETASVSATMTESARPTPTQTGLVPVLTLGSVFLAFILLSSKKKE